MFSKLKGIVHCRVILVTLLAKASHGPALRAHFECLALIWSFVTPHPVASMAPAPLAMERSWTTDLSPYPPPGREHWHHNSNTHLHILSLTLWHTSIFTTHPPNEPQPMVYFPAVHSHSTTPLSHMLFFSLSPPSWRLPGSRESLHTHIHPTMPLRVFRMSLCTSWSVQVVGMQTQSLPAYVCISPIYWPPFIWCQCKCLWHPRSCRVIC